jgi:hypothetical protein
VGERNYSVRADYPYALDTWHHIAVIGDGARLTLYLDGVEAASGAAPVPDYGTSAFPFNIGGGGIHDAGGNWYTGLIDDVRLYSRALSATEVDDIYQLGFAPAAPVITSTAPATAVVDMPCVCTIGTSGYPWPDVTWSENVSWLTLDGNVLSGTPSGTDVGFTVDITVTATNTEGSDTQGPFQIEVLALDPAMVAWWKMDEAAGSSVPDASGSGNDGTVNGAVTWNTTGGVVDGCADFEGADDFILVADSASLNSPTSAITICTWVYGHNNWPNDPRFVQKGVGNTQYGFMREAGNLKLRLRLGGIRNDCSRSQGMKL